MKKTIEDALLESQQEIKFEAEKMNAMGGLVAGVSHEINTPLGVNIGNCTLLIELLSEVKEQFNQGKLDENGFHEFLETAQDLSSSMLKNMQRAARLLSNFKRVAVKNTDEATLLENTDVSELINDFINSYKNNSQNNAVTFVANCPPHVRVVTYPSVIRQILTALTSNTLIHGISPEKQGCTITISLAPAGDGYQLTFSDNGQGINETQLKKVFEPFFTTKRGAGNAGLGLSIVYNMVKGMLSSDVHYESAIDQGFSVSFKLHNLAIA